MTLENYVKEFKQDIDSDIRARGIKRIDNDERELFVMNDEYMYNKALSRGVTNI